MGAVSLTLVALTIVAVAPAPSLVVDPIEARLRGSDARVQIVVSDRSGIDLTHASGIEFKSLDPRVAQVEPSGGILPTGDGETRVMVRAGGSVASLRVIVSDYADRRAVRFAGEIVPILTKLGCNAGACHGKSSGQNGFRLSLLGADPAFDHESLVRDGRGRRVFPMAPEASLMLRKPTTTIPHGGGRRLEPNSPEYRMLRRWIGQGMPFDPADEPELIGLEVRPGSLIVHKKAGQQLRVVAQYGDGTESDVTRRAQFQSNAPDLADVDGTGKVAVRAGMGEAAIMARFGGQVGVARVTVPFGSDVPPRAWDSPPPRNLVDRLVFARLKTLGLPPSPPCTDAEFARRSALDLCGILPDPVQVVALETECDPDKRVKWVDRLLDRPEFADRFAMIWTAILRNKRTLGRLSQPGTFAFSSWVKQALAENMPYDQFVTAILTATGDAAVNPAVVWYRQASTAEDQADDTAQLFLGLRLQCARCHRHPFERWSQADYYGFASLFSRIGRKPGSDPATPQVFVLADGQATDPAGRSYPPRLLGSADVLTLAPGRDPRKALAEWLRRPDNPFFARAVVNRYWKHLFGRGLIEPEDDLRASNPPTDPELLDALAGDFITHGFDLKRLVRLLATSRAYERSSEPNAWNMLDRQAYSRFLPRRLPAEVLLDAIDTVTGTPETFAGLPPGTRAVQLPDEGFDTPGRFLSVFGRPKRESVCECERSSEASLTQSLLLLNSPEIERKVASSHGRAARWTVDPRPDTEKVNELYRIALVRRPTTEERSVCLAHLARRRNEGKLQQGYEDLIWSVINTKEFAYIE